MSDGEITRYQPQHPDLWDAENDIVRLAPNGRSVKVTKKDALRILTPMFAMWPNIEMNEVGIMQYVRLLADIPPELLQQAVDEAIMHSSYLPTVKDIRSAYESSGVRRRAYGDGPSEESIEGTRIHQFGRGE